MDNGQIISGGEPIASDAASVISSPTKKKNRTPLILLCLFFLIALVVFIVINVFQQKTPAKVSTASAFYKYANFVLYGTDSNAPVTESYDPAKSYSLPVIPKSISDLEIRNSAVKNAMELDSEFYGLVANDSTEYSKDEDGSLPFSTLALREHELLQFIYGYYTKAPLLQFNVIEYYKENGSIATINYIENYYDGVFTDDNSYIENYTDTFLTWGNSIIGRLDLYATSNCTYNNDSCLESTDEGSEKVIQSSTLLDAIITSQDILSSYSDIYNEYFYTLFEIAGILGDGE